MLQESYISDIVINAQRIEVRHGPLLEPFLKDHFYAAYESECNLLSLDEAVAAVPFVLATAAIVWSAGLRLKIQRLDAALAASLPRLKAEYARMYPGISWDGEIEVLNTVSASGQGGQAGMLFSGGLDSIHAALCVPGHKHLFTVWGADTDPDQDLPWRHIRQRALEFASKHGHSPVFVRSNFRQFLNAERLHTRFKEISHWYAHVQHGPALIGLTAPILLQNAADSLIIAGSHAEGQLRRGWGSSRALDESIGLGNVRVMHAGYEYSRQEKMHAVVQACKQNGTGGYSLRVCPSLKYRDDSNCGGCEKCQRTAVGLIIEGENPRDWGLPFGPREVLQLMQENWRRFRLKLTANELPHWSSIQKRLRATAIATEHREFMEWFAKVDLQRYAAIYNILSGRFLYTASPRSLRVVMRNMYYKYYRKMRT